MPQRSLIPCVTFALLVISPAILFAQDPIETERPLPTATIDRTVIQLPESGLPDYDSLRFEGGAEQPLGSEFLNSILELEGRIVEANLVFPEVPEDAEFAAMRLSDLIFYALDSNFNLQISTRNIIIARSNLRSAESDFIPFVDLIGEGRYLWDEDNNFTFEDASTRRIDPDTGQPIPGSGQIRTSDRVTAQRRFRGGVESGVNLPTGGALRLNADQTRTSVSRYRSVPSDESLNYTSNVEIRAIQPLLRGAGSDIAQADLRRARIREIDQILSDQLLQRDTIFSVIQQYFTLLQNARQLQVSADAIRERFRFVEDTLVRFELGRVDESEVLRAEINYLSELETAISRRQQLDTTRENILLLLGLPLDTPISFVDITTDLAARGRINIPSAQQAVEEMLNSRQELLRSDLQEALAVIDRRVARNNVLPSLDIDGGYRRSDLGDNFSDSIALENQGFDAGITFRMPLINIREREAARRANISLEQRRIDRLSLERDLIADTFSRHRAVLTTEAQLTLLSKQVEQARKSLELINGKYEVGFASVTEVRLAQDDLFNAETRYSNALLNYQLAIARLYVAIGRPLI